MALTLDEAAARNAARHLRRQREITGCLPDDRTILLEHFTDEAGDQQLMVHSIFGRRVNDGLALLMQQAASAARRMGSAMGEGCSAHSSRKAILPPRTPSSTSTRASRSR